MLVNVVCRRQMLRPGQRYNDEDKENLSENHLETYKFAKIRMLQAQKKQKKRHKQPESERRVAVPEFGITSFLHKKNFGVATGGDFARSARVHRSVFQSQTRIERDQIKAFLVARDLVNHFAQIDGSVNKRYS